MKVQINKPCAEDWAQMTPEVQGKFCSVCEKSVVDFSEMSDAEILHYFSKPKSEKVCGRFSASQVDRDLLLVPVSKPPVHLLHFAYVLVVVLGVGIASCSPQVQGEVKIATTQESVQSKDSQLHQNPRENGKPSIPASEEERIMGDTVIVQPPVKKDTASACKPKTPKAGLPAPKSYIKGKVKISQPNVIEPLILGECVIPYEYEGN